MVVPPRPAPPRPIAGLPEDQQAKVLHQEYIGALGWGAELEKKLKALSEWVDRLYQETPNADAH